MLEDKMWTWWLEWLAKSLKKRLHDESIEPSVWSVCRVFIRSKATQINSLLIDLRDLKQLNYILFAYLMLCNSIICFYFYYFIGRRNRKIYIFPKIHWLTLLDDNYHNFIFVFLSHSIPIFSFSYGKVLSRGLADRHND